MNHAGFLTIRRFRYKGDGPIQGRSQRTSPSLARCTSKGLFDAFSCRRCGLTGAVAVEAGPREFVVVQPDWIEQHLVQVAQLLPAQVPITAFVFLNSHQALEDLPFEEGLQVGREFFGCETYLSEDRYREKMARGRIRGEDLAETLRSDLGERWNAPIGTAFDLRMAMLLHPVRLAPAPELDWFVAETDTLSKSRSEVTSEPEFGISTVMLTTKHTKQQKDSGRFIGTALWDDG